MRHLMRHAQINGAPRIPRMGARSSLDHIETRANLQFRTLALALETHAQHGNIRNKKR